MAYRLERNGKCEDGFKRCKWASLGRTMASQSSNAIDELGRIFTWGRNYYSQCGQGPGTSNDYLTYIEFATQLGSANNWVKACSGELSTIAINTKGELWGWGRSDDDCEPFGLPPLSGDNGDTIFYYPRLVTPGYLWKDFTHDYYHTMAIDANDKLWVWGMDYDYAFGMGGVGGGSAIPIQHTLLTDDVKLIDCEYLCNIAVTTDDKVYIWGDNYSVFWAVSALETPYEVLGLTIPPGETIIEATASYMGITILLSDGSLWAAGDGRIFGDVGVTGDSTILIKVPFFIGKGVVKVRNTALGSRSVFVIDDQGNIWGWGTESYVLGNTIVQVYNSFQLVINNFEGEHKWIDVVNNEHNLCFQAIDESGYMYTWGYQGWGPHLAIGAASSTALAALDPNITDVVLLRIYAGKAAMALDYSGDLTTLNAVPLGISEYLQPLDQDKRHRPCGHWHLREFEEEELYPQNCWMPSLAVHDGTVFFVAAGKHQQRDVADTGSEVMFFTYDIDAGIWELIYYTENINASNYPGGAAIDVDIYSFFNWKANMTGTRFTEVPTNPGMGCWTYNVAGATLNYVEWTDNIAMSGQNKLGVHAGGLVALAYTDTTGQVLIKVSTDFGATFALVKTLPVDATRKDYSLVVDPNGHIYISYMVSHASIKTERSIDNGANWTVQSWANTVISNILEVKLVSDNTALFIFCASAIATGIERSVNAGVSWSTISGEPGSSIMGSATYPSADDQAIVLIDGDTSHYEWYASSTAWKIDSLGNLYVDTSISEGRYTVYGTMYNYIDDAFYGGFTWVPRDITHLSAESENMDISVEESQSTLEGYNGRFAYASYGFFSAPDHHVAIVLSNDSGVNWYVVSTPLGWNSENEIGDFKGCPLFSLTDVPYLNHIWTFEKGDWAEKFVKQKDKYVKVDVCQPDK